MSNLYFQVVHQLITKGHTITDLVGKAMRPFGLTEPQYNVLRLLSAGEGQPLSVQKVQEGMVQKGSNVTRIVDKLVAKNLVDRSECPTNRRKMDLTMTEEGARLLETLDKEVVKLHQPIKASMTKEELVTLGRLLKKIQVE